MIVLWLLILRGIGIEFRTHLGSRRLARTSSTASSRSRALLLAVFFGAALGNVMRGVPLRADGYFFEPLWTDWRVGPEPGHPRLVHRDWRRTALAALAMHGATYLALKSEGDLNVRAHRLALRIWTPLLVLTALSLVATLEVRPQLLDNYRMHWINGLIPLTVVASMVAIPVFVRRRSELAAFLSSGIYLATMLAGAAAALYPIVLPSSGDSSRSITIFNAAAGRSRAVSGPLVVDRRNPAGRRLLRLRLPHGQRESQTISVN